MKCREIWEKRLIERHDPRILRQAERMGMLHQLPEHGSSASTHRETAPTRTIPVMNDADMAEALDESDDDMILNTNVVDNDGSS